MDILAYQTMKVLGAGDNLLEHVLPVYSTRLSNGAPAPFSFSNHILMMLIAAFLVLVIFSWLGAKAKTTMVPTGAHNFFESILSFLRTELIRPALGENSDRFTPFIWSVFFFILFCNVLGLIPVNEILNVIKGVQHKEGVFHPVHFWGTATANFSMTGGLAVVAFITVHASGLLQAIRVKMDPSLAPHHHGTDHTEPHGHGQWHGMEGVGDEADVVLEHKVGDGHDHAHGLHHSKQFGGQPLGVAIFTGFGSYLWNFAPHPQAGGPLMDTFLWAALLVLELTGSLVKPFSLCVRLFANMVAGHLVLAALVSMIPFAAAALVWGPVSLIVVAGCAALSMLELFVAFLQAYIFTFLTTLFIASAVAPEH